jgi:hypothetical protein
VLIGPPTSSPLVSLALSTSKREGHHVATQSTQRRDVALGQGWPRRVAKSLAHLFVLRHVVAIQAGSPDAPKKIRLAACIALATVVRVSLVREPIAPGSQRGTREQRRASTSGLARRLLVLTVSVACTACSFGPKAKQSPRALQKGQPSASVQTSAATAPVPPAERAAIIRGFTRSYRAFDAAATGEERPYLPALVATTADPLRRTLEQGLERLRKEGAVGRGVDRIVWVKVTWVRAAAARVVACIDGGLIAVNRLTGRPMPGIAGRRDWLIIHDQMIRMNNQWMPSVSWDIETKRSCQ